MEGKKKSMTIITYYMWLQLGRSSVMQNYGSFYCKLDLDDIFINFIFA